MDNYIRNNIYNFEFNIWVGIMKIQDAVTVGIVFTIIVMFAFNNIISFIQNITQSNINIAVFIFIVILGVVNQNIVKRLAGGAQ